MRLLNATTFELKMFMGAEADIPPYAILSHTWETTEIVFEDIKTQSYQNLARNYAFQKVFQCCLQARKDNFQYVWIDTCCIDKSSSAELSEAINSMFKYYAQSSKCYVYLADFRAPPSVTSQYDARLHPDDTSFFNCRWFDRGWTLQELIAPRKVEFFDRDWKMIGTRDGELLDRVCHRSRIWPHVFREPRCTCLSDTGLVLVRDGICVNCRARDTLERTLSTFAVSIKMSWVSARVTTRTEDAAYCLLGLFGINMPLLYGEGAKAFLRLQEAIVRQSKDQSILLWQAFRTETRLSTALGCLAPGAGFFKHPIPIIGRRVFNDVNRHYEADFMGRMAPMDLTDTALMTKLWMCPCTVVAFDPEEDAFVQKRLWLGILDLAMDDDYLKRPAILLEHMGTVNLYRRVYNQLIVSVNPREVYTALSITVGNATVPSEALVDRSIITVTRDLSEATQQDVGILLQQSPMNVVRVTSSQDKAPATGPVYVVVKPRKHINTSTDSGGTHPLFNSYESRSSHIAAPWNFERCDHGAANRFLAGIHFLDIAFDKSWEDNKQVVEIVVVWGMHADYPDLDEQSAKDSTNSGASAPPWKTWCRIFDLKSFTKHARTSEKDLRPTQLFRRIDDLGPGEIERRIKDQRRRLALAGYESLWIHQMDGPKRLFPDSVDDEWTMDRLKHAFEDIQYLADITAKVNRVEGLGRTIYELEIGFEASEKKNWALDYLKAREKEPGRFPAPLERVLEQQRREHLNEMKRKYPHLSKYLDEET